MAARLFAILILVLAGMSQVGAGRVGEDTRNVDCGWTHRGQVAIHRSCCSLIDGEVFCPINGGPCHCVAAPSPHPERRPEAPLPRSERESLTAVPASPSQVGEFVESDERALVERAQILALHEDLTSNAIQALLGVWRT